MKFVKYSFIAIALFLVTAVGFFLYSVSKLPDPVTIKKEIDKQVPAKSDIQNEISDEIESLSQVADEKEPIPVGESAKLEKSAKTIETQGGSKIFDLIKEDYKDIRICENLGRSSKVKMDLNIVQDALYDNHRNDPAIESFRVPLKNVFQSKPVKELFSEIERLDKNKVEGEERSSYLQKVGFYALAAKKAQEMYSMKSEYEEVSDRAYDLYVISEIAKKKPELAQDKAVLDYCNELEASIGNKAKTDLKEEKKEILKLIDYAGLTPQELNFDPEARTKFQISLTKKALSFGFNHPGIKL